MTQLKKPYIPSKQIWDDKKSDEGGEYFWSDDNDKKAKLIKRSCRG
jgi:hypothetical protein